MTENPDPQSRIERVNYYLNQNLHPTSRAHRVHLGQVLRGRLFNPDAAPPRHHTEGVFLDALTKGPVPEVDTIYMAFEGVYEIIRKLTTTPPDSTETDLGFRLAEQAALVCGFDRNQLRNTLGSITEGQMQQLARVIAESSVPLMYAWDEPQVLHEIFLATGVRSASIKSIAIAHFNGPENLGKYRDWTPIKGDYWLLNAGSPDIRGNGHHYLSLTAEPDVERGEGLETYKLLYECNYKKSPHEAFDDFKRSIDRFSGQGASREIKVYRPDLVN